MLSESTARQASEVRVLFRRGIYAGRRVPLRNGGTLPAEMFAKVVFDDLDRLTSHDRAGLAVSEDQWQRLADDLQLLHRLAALPSHR